MGMEFGLSDRINWVLTGTRGAIPVIYNLCTVSNISKLEQGLNLYKTTEDLWIIGGKSIYDQLHPYAEEVHLTRINQDFPDADVYLDTSWLCDFELVGELPLNDYSHVEIYKRKEK
jgi:dihydrofolate reductase